MGVLSSTRILGAAIEAALSEELPDYTPRRGVRSDAIHDWEGDLIREVASSRVVHDEVRRRTADVAGDHDTLDGVGDRCRKERLHAELDAQTICNVANCVHAVERLDKNLSVPCPRGIAELGHAAKLSSSGFPLSLK